VASIIEINNQNKLDLDLSRTNKANARVDAVERILQKTLESQSISNLMREMVGPDQQMVVGGKKTHEISPQAALIKTNQIWEFTNLSYKVDANLLSNEEQTVVMSIKRKTGQKFGVKAPIAHAPSEPIKIIKMPKQEQPKVGYHAKLEHTETGKYRRVA